MGSSLKLSGPLDGKQIVTKNLISFYQRKGVTMPTLGFYQGQFEVEFLPYLQGSIEAQVYEKGEAPSRIIDINDPWFVEVNWSLTGPLQRFICGTWGVDVYLESIGKG